MSQLIQKQKPEKTGCTLTGYKPSVWGCLRGGRKILESETNFLLVYLQKSFVGVVAGNQVKLSAECPAAAMFFFSVPGTRIIGAKVVYMVLGS